MKAFVKVSLGFVSLSVFSFSQETAQKFADINSMILEKQNEFRREIEKKVNDYILDPVLGKNRAYAFADVIFSVVTKRQEQTKEGVGVLQQYKEKGAGQSLADTDFILPGIPKPKAILGDQNRRPEAAHGAQTQQSKAIEEVMFSVEPLITRFQLTVVHDETISQELLMIARQRIDDLLLPYKVNGKDPPVVIFKPTRFKKTDIWDDLKKPSVYLPLLYALLFLLLLLYLFGPLWSFLRRYIKALLAKPGAEVNIEEKREEGGGKGKGEGEEKQQSHQEIDMRFTQKEEEPPPEEEEMKKFEPFTYINEENIKRLVYLFLLRKEDPWIIAVVLSYIKPELAKQVFAMLPLELQSRVAIESVKVKQATREQIEAIDKDIKENVEFVMGGVEQLMRILEEADAQTRKNVLEYLKNQKPDIYDKIKAVMLSFEDLINFTDKDIQIVIRSVSQEDLAKALKNASVDIVEKFFKNMSQGAQASIKEVMEYMGEVTPQQSDEAQMKILDAVKTLEAEGKILSYRRNEQGLVYILDSSDVSSINRDQKLQKTSQQSSSNELEDYMNAAVEFYNQQNYNQAEEYLRYVIQQDPNNALAWQYLGSVYYALERYQDAVNAYQRYVDLSGDTQFSSWLDELKRQLGM
ncbi:MAG: FliG C-terminal domain-containing protein [Elusimicrobiales bacterium]